MTGCTLDQKSSQSQSDQQRLVEQQQKILEAQADTIEALQLRLGELEKSSESESRVATTTLSVPTPIPTPTPKVPSENLDSVLINYKLDAQDGKGLRESVIAAATNSPDQFCPSVIASRKAQNNIYYLVVENLNKLEADYGKYRSRIGYIDVNLDGLWGVIQLVKDKCTEAGYNI